MAPGVTGDAGPGAAVLANLVRKLFVHLPAVAEHLAGEPCNAKAAGPKNSSQSGKTRNLGPLLVRVTLTLTLERCRPLWKETELAKAGTCNAHASIFAAFSR